MSIRSLFSRKPSQPNVLRIGGADGWTTLMTQAHSTVSRGLWFWSLISMIIPVFVLAVFGMIIYLAVSWFSVSHDDMARYHCSQAYDPDACMRLLAEPAARK